MMDMAGLERAQRNARATPLACGFTGLEICYKCKGVDSWRLAVCRRMSDGR